MVSTCCFFCALKQTLPQWAMVLLLQENAGWCMLDRYRIHALHTSEMQRLQLNAATVRLKAVPLVACHLISPAHLDNLIAELAQYQLVCACIDWDDKSFAQKTALVEEFWARLPAWTKFAHLCMLLQPSSACVERAFSMLCVQLKYIMGDQQYHSLLGR